jgi:hypothetical protein
MDRFLKFSLTLLCGIALPSALVQSRATVPVTFHHPASTVAAGLNGTDVATRNFTSIPEVDPAVPAIVLCVAAVIFAQLRKRRI